MADALLSGISIYPVKSCAGIERDAVSLGPFGPEGDRRWLLVDGAGQFVTQRDLPRLALVKPSLDAGQLALTIGDSQHTVSVPSAGARRRPVSVWGDTLEALDAGDEVADWLFESLSLPCRLVYMPDDARRQVEPLYARRGELVSFADGFPLLLISEASLADLNARLEQPVPMNRFRPNLVVSGCDAFAEDRWRRIRIGRLEFDVAKPCARCVMPSIDQATAQRDPQINRVLASYRRRDGQVYFGQNLLYSTTGDLAVGDAVDVLA